GGWTETLFGIQTLRRDASGGRRIPVPATYGFRAALHGHRTRVAGAERELTDRPSGGRRVVHRLESASDRLRVRLARRPQREERAAAQRRRHASQRERLVGGEHTARDAEVRAVRRLALDVDADLALPRDGNQRHAVGVGEAEAQRRRRVVLAQK